MRIRRMGLIPAVLLLAFLGALLATGQKNDQAEVQLKAAMHKELVDGDLKGAIEQYQQIIKNFGVNRSVIAQALVQMGQCHEKLGTAEARNVYERVVREFVDQPESARIARERLAVLGKVRRDETVTRRVWEESIVSVEGTVSADGRYISFVDWETGDLAVHDFASGQSRRLTGKEEGWKTADMAGWSIISPDSKRLAFEWFNPMKGPRELRLIGIDGSGSRLLYDHPEVTYIQPADWSPNGKFILAGIARKDKTSELVVFSLEDDSVRVIQTFKDGKWFEEGQGEKRAKATFSPDGRYIAHDRQQDIYVIDLNTGQEVPIIHHPADDALLGWAPDGRGLVFLSDRAQTNDVWMIDVTDGKPRGAPRLLRNDVGSILPLGLTKAGSLYYGVSASAFEVYAAEFDLATGKRTRGPDRATGRFVNSTFMADWSPDGKRLAYLITGPGSQGMPSAIVVLPIGGTSKEQKIPLKLSLQWSLRWHPDGRSLIVRGSNGQEEGLFRVDVATGDERFLLPSKYSSLGGVDYAPDGASVFYASDDPGGKGRILRARDLKTGQDKEVAHDSMFDFSLSPDGRRILYMRPGSPQRLVIVPAGGGTARVLVAAKEGDAITAFAWTPDARQVVFAKSNGPTQASSFKAGMWRVSAEGGEPQPLDLMAEGVLRSLRVHPDGRRLAYAVLKFRSEVWAMENLVPPQEARKTELTVRRAWEGDILLR